MALSEEPLVKVWQYLVKHPKRGYVMTRGYYTTVERCRQCLKNEYHVLKKINASVMIVPESRVREWEQKL